jgi:hypothetical protein
MDRVRKLVWTGLILSRHFRIGRFSRSLCTPGTMKDIKAPSFAQGRTKYGWLKRRKEFSSKSVPNCLREQYAVRL